MINLFKKYVINSQFYVSFMATLFTLFFMLENSIMEKGIAVLVFFTFLNGYLYTKYQARKKEFVWVLIFNAITFLGCVVYIFYHHHFEFFPKWIAIVVFGLLYNSSLLDFHVRRFPFVKIFYVALVWALTNAWMILPKFDGGIFFINFFFISALILPFDIRDMKSDKVVTFPNTFGVQKTKYFAYILAFLAGIISIYSLQPAFSLAFLLTILLTFVFIYFSEENRSDLYYSFGVETMDGIALVFLGLLSLFGIS